jgi:uncharacterized protein
MYIAYCKDYQDGRATEHRLAHLEAHLRYIESILDKLAVAGPLKHADGKLAGSTLVYKVGTEAEARALIEGDPYFHAPIWEKVELHAIAPVAGDWIGGKKWGTIDDIVRKH